MPWSYRVARSLLQAGEVRFVIANRETVEQEDRRVVQRVGRAIHPIIFTFQPGEGLTLRVQCPAPLAEKPNRTFSS